MEGCLVGASRDAASDTAGASVVKLLCGNVELTVVSEEMLELLRSSLCKAVDSVEPVTGVMPKFTLSVVKTLLEMPPCTESGTIG